MAEERAASLDPVLHGPLGVEQHFNDKVGGVAGGAEGALALARLVDGTVVALVRHVNGRLERRLEPDHWHLVVENLGELFSEAASVQMTHRR